MDCNTIICNGKEYYLVPKEQQTRKVAVIAGHTEANKGDYSSLFGVYEHDFWNEFIRDFLPDWIETYEHDPFVGYTQRQKAMAEKTKDCDLVIELHWNAFDPDKDGKDNAEGTECLVWHTNDKMKKLGAEFIELMHSKLEYKKRKVVAIDSGNGAGFLRETNGDAILLEPFFADNSSDVTKFNKRIYANIILKLIENYYGED